MTPSNNTFHFLFKFKFDLLIAIELKQLNNVIKHKGKQRDVLIHKNLTRFVRLLNLNYSLRNLNLFLSQRDLFGALVNLDLFKEPLVNARDNFCLGDFTFILFHASALTYILLTKGIAVEAPLPNKILQLHHYKFINHKMIKQSKGLLKKLLSQPLKSSNSLVVEHSFSKRKVAGSIPPLS